MANVRNVAAFILKRLGAPTSTWKLQKLVYYAQAWHSVWDDADLIHSRIEAWANGPVCPELYEIHRGAFTIKDIATGNCKKLTKSEKATVEAVVDFYKKFNGQQLSDLTHKERPWKQARKGLAPGERSHREITLESMSEYYSSL